jgi:hypothetical protein
MSYLIITQESRTEMLKNSNYIILKIYPPDELVRPYIYYILL